MNNDKFTYTKPGEFKVLDHQCEACDLYDKENKSCLVYKQDIPEEVYTNKEKCKNWKHTNPALKAIKELGN